MLISIVLSYIILSSEITYTRDAKPLFQKYCAQCHNAGWPDKNWLNYDTAKENALKIKERVYTLKNMPLGLSSITDSEREVIKQWVDQGAKK